MKKVALLTMFLLGALLIYTPQVSAQEVYAVTETHPSSGKITDHYIITETIQEQGPAFGVGVHSVGKNYSHNDYWNVMYAYINGKWNWVMNGNLALSIPIDKIDEPMLRSVIYGIFKTAREYM